MVRLWFYVDFHSHVPIYVQIVENVKALIAQGKLRPGDFMPSIRALAQDLGVNLNTVARAYRELELEGVIEVQRGEGYVVRGIDGSKLREDALVRLKTAAEKCRELGVRFEESLAVLREVFKDDSES